MLDPRDICALLQDGAWAGLHEQVALIRLKGKLLCIHQAGQPCWTIRPDFHDVPKVRCFHLCMSSLNYCHLLELPLPSPLYPLCGTTKQIRSMHSFAGLYNLTSCKTLPWYVFHAYLWHR